MRVGSLCTGYGGLDAAVVQHYGATLAWVGEIEPAACRVLAAHHPDVPNLGDLTVIDWTTVEPVDVLTAGYPCQPFSHAGNRKGKNDDRHLWPYIATAIGTIRPRQVVPPDPTVSGVNGRPRLSPRFVEWMMGLPDGHVTGHGLSNAQALKMLGNGVVPAQAALALRLLDGAPCR